MKPELQEALWGLDELAQENAREALEMFYTLPSPVQELPDFQLVLARTHQALGSLEKARDLSLHVVEAHDDWADAHHLLADLLEDLGEGARANHHFLRTLALDRASFERESELPPKELFDRLEAILTSTCESLPVKFSLKSRVQLLPGTEDVETGLDPRALTSYRPPQADNDEAVLTLYAANLDAEFGDLQEFGEFAPYVQRAIQDELATHLSLSPAELRGLGWDLPDLDDASEA
jgi:tetratricopeptide (TPR) repeat protein